MFIPWYPINHNFASSIPIISDYPLTDALPQKIQVSESSPRSWEACGIFATQSVYLVGGFNPSEKYESQLGLLFPIYGKCSKPLCAALRNALPWVKNTALLSVGYTTVNATPSSLVWAFYQTPKTAYERALPKTIAAIGQPHQATGHTRASQGNKQTYTPHGWPVCNSETAQEHQHDAAGPG